MTESVVGKEEEERHQKLVTENEQLKRQIEEVIKIVFSMGKAQDRCSSKRQSELFLHGEEPKYACKMYST